MARPRLSTPHQPLPLRWLLRLYEACASLQLAVIVIFGSAAVMAWATLVESRFGTEAVRFGIYRTWWFYLIFALLGLNVLCAMLIRFPWKRHQTGFVITHLGIIVLLIGCLQSAWYGIDAQIPIFEDRANWRAYEDTQHFRIEVQPVSPGLAAEEEGVAARRTAGGGNREEAVTIPFAGGPFNWEEYDGLNLWPRREGLHFLPWGLVGVDGGVLYDRDGIRLEVLDYYSDSEEIPVPQVTFRMLGAPRDFPSPHGQAADREPVTLSIRRPEMAQGHLGIGSRRRLANGVNVTFAMAASEAETAAFLDSAPEEPLGELGQVVLHYRGERFAVPMAQLQGEPRVPLGETGLEVELVEFDPRFLNLHLRTHGGEQSPGRLLLFADSPEFNQQDRANGVFGTFWFDATQDDDARAVSLVSPDVLMQARQPRIDIIQGADLSLYRRTWQAPELTEAGPLPHDGRAVEFLAESPLRFMVAVEHFLPSAEPGTAVRPRPFRKQTQQPKRPQARVRLTVDEQSSEFWLESMGADPLELPPRRSQLRTVRSAHREARISLRRDYVDVGFQVHLHRFERKLDPGTSQAAYYASVVDFRDRDDPEEVLAENVLITLNAPVDYTDPRRGRSYRLFQESFAGPWAAGDDIFEMIVDGNNPRTQLFLSWLTVNYDPGRGFKYLGSLLIVVGMFTMFYMKSFFLRSPAREAVPGGPESR